MAKSNLEKIREAGIVGAGGAGFPTHIKIANKASVIIANGAECEPLLRVDRQMMETFPEKIVEGLQVVMRISNAEKGVICLKEKYHQAADRLSEVLKNKKRIELHFIGNYYPAGDEQQLVYEVTGKAVPTGGLPIDAGAIVCNVSTLINIAYAVEGTPVTHKYVTVNGSVGEPCTLNAPLGTPIQELIRAAKGPASESEGYTVIAGGPMMGRIENDWTVPVTKGLGGLIVLPSDHKLVMKKNASLDKEYRLAKSVCCQCNYCTQICPRNALGLNVEPHKIMRAIGYGDPATLGGANSIFSCCDCGLCTYYACNMELSPGRMVTAVKNALLKKGVKPVKNIFGPVNAMREYGKVPVKRLIERLGLGKYDGEAPLQNETMQVDCVRIPLKQHIGAPAQPVVNPGDVVAEGDLIGAVAPEKVGANVHASISGSVTAVNEQFVEIRVKG